MTELAPTTLREAVFDDGVEVYGLLKRLGLGVPSDPVEVHRTWARFWRDNPALSADRPAPPIGWVLESERRVVGFFGSIPLRYQIGDRPLIVGCASQWGVEKPFRKSTDQLATAYFAQPNVDLLMVTTAIRATGRIFERHGATLMPQRDYDRVLYWVLGARGFLAAALRKKEVRPELAAVGGLALSPLLAGVVALQRRHPGRASVGIEPDTVSLSGVGDEFDELWQTKLAERPRLLAARSASDLRWHFAPAEEKGKLILVRCRRGGRLAGYLALQREEIPSLGLVRAKIADLLVAGDDPVIIDALLHAAVEISRERGCHVLELIGMTRAIRAQAERYRPFSRAFPCSPFHYKATSPELGGQLAREDDWYPSLYDGDNCIG
jgi:hypothetical protein